MTCGEVFWDLFKLGTGIAAGAGFLVWRECLSLSREDRKNEKDRSDERRKLLTEKLDAFIDEIHGFIDYLTSVEVLDITLGSSEDKSIDYKEVILKIEENSRKLDKYTELYFDSLSDELSDVKHSVVIFKLRIQLHYESTSNRDSVNLIKPKYAALQKCRGLLKNIYERVDCLRAVSK